MIVTLAFDTKFFADKHFQSLMERFFLGELTHTQVAKQLKQKPEEISALLGSIFVVALKTQNSLLRLNIFPELTQSDSTPFDIEQSHFQAGGLPEDIATELLVLLTTPGGSSALRDELQAEVPG